MRPFDHMLADSISEAELLALIGKLNTDPAVSGILVQLPLPPQIDTQKVIEAIDPAKDVDGFHPLNAGRLARGLPGLVPCTPLGCVMLAKTEAAPAPRLSVPQFRVNSGSATATHADEENRAGNEEKIASTGARVRNSSFALR